MTAEEMFEELGYIPAGRGIYEKPLTVDNKGAWRYIKISIGEKVKKQYFDEYAGTSYDEYFSAKEVLACAQWIKEHTETEEKG